MDTVDRKTRSKIMKSVPLMWFNNNGHPIKSHEERNEVYDERKPQETELHERI